MDNSPNRLMMMEYANKSTDFSFRLENYDNIVR